MNYRVLLTVILIPILQNLSGQEMPLSLSEPATISAGSLQAEISYEMINEEVESIYENNAQFRLRYGLTENFEVFAAYDQATFNITDAHATITDPVSLGCKLYLFGDQKWWPAVGLLTAINIPTADAFSSSASLGLNMGKALNGSFGLGLNILSQFGEDHKNIYTLFPHLDIHVIEWSTLTVGYEYFNSDQRSIKGINFNLHLWLIKNATLSISYGSHSENDQVIVSDNVVEVGLNYRIK